MNLQVFLEWFHRLDAFLVGIALFVQLLIALIWRTSLPRWLPWTCGGLVALVVLQGGLGALTVLQLLPSLVVTAHLAIGLILLAAVSGMTERLSSPSDIDSPLWWKLFGGGALIAVMSQCLVGGLMASSWASQRCINHGQACQWLDLHRWVAVPVAVFVLMFVAVALLAGGWPRSNWPLLFSVLGLVILQICLGMLAVHLGLSKPFVTISHQMIAALLVAILAALAFKRPQEASLSALPFVNKSSVESCHG